MGKGDQKINEKLCGLHEQLRSIFKKIKLPKYKFNTKNNMSELVFVIPGHYRHRESAEFGSKESSIDMIRVLGEDPNKDDFFIVHDGVQNKSLHESFILSEYVFVPTAASDRDKPKDQLTPKHLFAGIGDKEPEVVQPFVDPATVPAGEHISFRDVAPKIPTAPIYSQEQQFTINILSKLKQTNTNKLSVTVDIDLPYDINKLRESVELLNLDKATLIQYLLNDLNLFDSISNSLKIALSDQMSNVQQTPIQNEQQAQPIHTVQPTVQVEEIIQPIEVIQPKVIVDNSAEIVEAMKKIDSRFENITSSLI